MTTEEREEVKAYFQSRLEWHKENRYPYVSAQEIRVCKIALEALNNNIDVAEGTIISQSCEDAISRQAVKEQMIKYGFHAPDMTVTEFVEDLPPVNPTKTGHWIHHEEKMFVSAEQWECSCCHRTTMTYPFSVKDNDYDAMYYCPKCGAKMVEPQESEEKE